MSNSPLWNKIDQWTRLSHLSFPVPSYSSRLSHTLGGITLMGFLILFGTGLFLTQFFNSMPDSSNASVHYIVEKVTGGRWIRSLHYWTAQAVILSLCAHIIRVFITGAYKFPRILTWYFGTALFFTTMMISYFSGTVIKWDQEGSEALEHYETVVGMLGPLGKFLGSELTTTVSMNARMYSVHIAIGPLLLIALVAGHFYLIHVFNIAPLPGGPYSRQTEVPETELKGTFTEHFFSIFRFSLIFYGAVAILARFVPAPLRSAPMGEPTGIKPPWIYYWQYGIENFIGMEGILYSSIALVLIFLIVPLMDRGPSREYKDRKAVLSVGAVTLLAITSLTVYGWLSPEQVHHHGGHNHAHEHQEEVPAVDGVVKEAPSEEKHHHQEGPAGKTDPGHSTNGPE